METSAKTGDNIDKVVLKIIKKLFLSKKIQAFNMAASEVIKKIEKKEIDPTNEVNF